MIALSRESGKQYIHLGLGVNEGIRRFKKKWGGVPTRRYEMCEIRVRKPAVIETIKAYLNSARLNREDQLPTLRSDVLLVSADDQIILSRCAGLIIK